MTAAAISGTFSDFRTVKGRKVCQLVVEIPVEQADAALRALGGVPQPHDPKWVAIARLDPKAASKTEEPKERKAWADLRPSAQAGIRSGERDFRHFIQEAYHVDRDLPEITTDRCADAVRSICGVSSRSELDENQKARVLWHQLDRQYLLATGRLAHG